MEQKTVFKTDNEMITQQQIEEYGRIVSDAKHLLSVATENLNNALIEYWHQETGAVVGEKYAYRGQKEGQIVCFAGFYIKYGRVGVRLNKVNKGGEVSKQEQWNHIRSINEFKYYLTKL